MIGRSERLRRWFPLPFVAIVVLLLVLILVTPNLVGTSSPCAGCLSSEPELLVDWTSIGHENVTHFYVKGIGTVRFDTIAMESGTYAMGPGPFRPPATVANLNLTNHTQWNDSIVAVLTSGLMPLTLNVSTVYVDTSGNIARYIGTYAFEVSNGVLFYVSYVPTLGRVTSIPTSSLPLTLTLSVAP